MLLRTVLVAACLVLISSVASAQPSSRAAIAFASGVASGASDTSVGVGGAGLFDVNEWLSLDGQATFLAGDAGEHAITGAASVVLNLRRSSRKVVPYAAAGGGLYRASYDLTNPRFARPTGAEGGGNLPIVVDTPFGPIERVDGFLVPQNGATTLSVTDPATSLGGGVRVNLSRHLMFRPDVRTLVVFANGETRTFTIFGVNLGYRF